MAKYTIICSTQSHFEYHEHITIGSEMAKFPEANMSTRDVFDMIVYYVSNKIPLTIFTRRSESLNMIGQLIDKGDISADEVEVILIRGAAVDKYEYTEDGYLTNGWPIGILDSWEF